MEDRNTECTDNQNLKRPTPERSRLENCQKFSYQHPRDNHSGNQPHHQIGEHTSELQSHHDLVCRLLLEKKKYKKQKKKHKHRLDT